MSNPDIDALFEQAADLDDELFGETFYCERLSLEFVGKVADLSAEYLAAQVAQMQLEVSRKRLPQRLNSRESIIRLKTGSRLVVVNCIPSDADWIVLVTE
jgi:hypothetical protein